MKLNLYITCNEVGRFMNTCAFWAASHITAFFKIADTAIDLLHKGSCGAGFNIKRGVITELSFSSAPEHQLFIDNQKMAPEFATITNYIINELEKSTSSSFSPLHINYKFQVPIGAGYGTSASVALTTAFAINTLLDLGIPEIELWQMAHKAEIIQKTGLGDILGLYANSKFELRTKEGAPGIGSVSALNLDVSNYDLYTYSVGPLSKQNILTNPAKREIIISKGAEVFAKIQKSLTLDNFCSLALDFTKSVELLPKHLFNIINALPSSIKASQIMLGESLYFFVPKGEKLPQLENFTPVKEELTELTLEQLV